MAIVVLNRVARAITSTSVPHHCATAFSMQSYAESAYQPYADGYH